MKAVAVGYEKDLDPNCVKYVREHQGRVQKEEWEHAGELLASHGIPVGTLGRVGGAVGIGHR